MTKEELVGHCNEKLKIAAHAFTRKKVVISRQKNSQIWKANLTYNKFRGDEFGQIDVVRKPYV